MMQSLLSAVEAMHRATKSLSDFTPWPNDLQPVDKQPVACPAIDLILAQPRAHSLTGAIQAAAPFAEWRRTYSAEEVGQSFLDRYGYFELYGPSGHFHSTQARGYIAFWDAGLDYGWHHHQAAELYHALQGSPLFLSKSQPDGPLDPGQSRTHAPWEVHAMRTLDSPFLCYAVWTGAGLADLPAMTP